jgi:hypothetical protein
MNDKAVDLAEPKQIITRKRIKGMASITFARSSN